MCVCWGGGGMVYEVSPTMYLRQLVSAFGYSLFKFYKQTLEKIQLDSTIEVQFCAMCLKLFSFRESFIS